MSLTTIVPRNNCSMRQLFNATIVQCDNYSSPQLFLAKIIPPFLYKWSLQRGQSSRWLKSRGQRSANYCKWSSGWCKLLRAPPFLCKESGSPDDQNQRDGGAGIVANDHLNDPASSVSLQRVICKENCISDDQNQRDGGARFVANDYLDDPASSVLLDSFVNGHLHRGRSSGWPTFFGRMGLTFALDLLLV